MRAFEVHLNKKRLCVAGVGDDGVLSTILSHVIGNGRDEVNLTVSGMVCPANEHVRWSQPRIRTGDEIRIKVVESTVVDRPRKRYRQDPVEDKRNLKRYVRKMAREFGWKIVSAKKAKSN